MCMGDGGWRIQRPAISQLLAFLKFGEQQMRIGPSCPRVNRSACATGMGCDLWRILIADLRSGLARSWVCYSAAARHSKGAQAGMPVPLDRCGVRAWTDI